MSTDFNHKILLFRLLRIRGKNYHSVLVKVGENKIFCFDSKIGSVFQRKFKEILDAIYFMDNEDISPVALIVNMVGGIEEFTV